MKRAVGCVHTGIWKRKAFRRERQAGVVMAGQPSGGVLHRIILFRTASYRMIITYVVSCCHRIVSHLGRAAAASYRMASYSIVITLYRSHRIVSYHIVSYRIHMIIAPYRISPS